MGNTKCLPSKTIIKEKEDEFDFANSQIYPMKQTSLIEIIHKQVPGRQYEKECPMQRVKFQSRQAKRTRGIRIKTQASSIDSIVSIDRDPKGNLFQENYSDWTNSDSNSNSNSLDISIPENEISQENQDIQEDDQNENYNRSRQNSSISSVFSEESNEGYYQAQLEKINTNFVWDLFRDRLPYQQDQIVINPEKLKQSPCFDFRSPKHIFQNWLWIIQGAANFNKGLVKFKFNKKGSLKQSPNQEQSTVMSHFTSNIISINLKMMQKFLKLHPAESLNMSLARLSNRFDEISKMIQQRKYPLKQLRFHFGDALTSSINNEQVYLLCQYVSKCELLEQLDLEISFDRSKISEKLLKDISNCFTILKNLKSLKICYYHIPSQIAVIDSILKPISQISKLETFHFEMQNYKFIERDIISFKNFISKLIQLKDLSLNLKRNKFHRSSFRYLSELLLTLINLDCLELSLGADQKAYDEGQQSANNENSLANALGQLLQLKILKLDFSYAYFDGKFNDFFSSLGFQLKKLNLNLRETGNQSIIIQAGKIIALSGKNIEELFVDLSENKLESCLTEFLCQIRQLPKLRQFVFAFEQVQVSASKAIVAMELFYKFLNLQQLKLYLGHNKFNQYTMEKMLTILGKCKQIKDLVVSFIYNGGGDDIYFDASNILKDIQNKNIIY